MCSSAEYLSDGTWGFRYMIYAEGNAWSVSYKYTMACGSPMLAIESPYYEFFTRSLQPNVHYLPVSRTSICSSIDAQVNWATSHRDEVWTVQPSLHLLPSFESTKAVTKQGTLNCGNTHVCAAG